MSIYKTVTIYNTLYVGPPVYFSFTRIDQPGTIAPRTIVQIPMLGYMALGRDDVYIFDGNQPRPIGKPIRQELFANLDYTDVFAFHAWQRPDLGRIYLNVSYGRAGDKITDAPDTVFAYSYIEGQWMPDGPYQALGGGWAEYSNNVLIQNLIGTIANQTQTFDQMVRANQRQALITDGTNVYSLNGNAVDYVTPTNFAINSSFQTASVPLAVSQQTGQVVPTTVFGIKVMGNGLVGTVSMTVGASIGNDQYTTYGPFFVSFTQTMQPLIPVEIYGERFTVTLANANLNEAFSIKQLSLLHRPRGRV